MDGLKVGNFGQSSQYEDIDLSNEPDNEPVDPVNEPVESTEPVGPINPDTEPVDEPVEPTEPAQPESEPSSLKPTLPDSEPEEDFNFNEEKTFEYLSEKLGKDIKSFDDLKSVKQENPLDEDPYLKEFYDWRKKTGRPIEDWIKYQKDYSKLSDLDVAREFLQHEYPSFTPEEIDDELESFQSSDDDLEDDIRNKARQLKKYATKGRAVLQDLVSDLSDVSPNVFTPEIKEDLELAKQVKENYIKSQKQQEDYNKNITSVTNSVDSLKLDLADDLSIDFKIPDESKKTLPEMITSMPHWKNEDGSFNHKAIVEDAVIIKHYKQMLKLAYEQGVNSGKEDIIKQTSNTQLGEPIPMSSVPTGGKGIEIEGFDDFVGSGMKLKFKN